MGTVLIPGVGLAQEIVSRRPGQQIVQLSRLRRDEPVAFEFPDNSSPCFLVKLGSPAANGIGPTRDIVAFSSLCTHQGGPLQGIYKAEHKVAGPCPLHLTTFDLSRRGIIVSGHGTEPLPQVLLESRGDDIYAMGFVGLVFGRVKANSKR